MVYAPRAIPDHPRSRGVYGPWAYVSHGDCGSSPLARGLRLKEGSRSEHSRIIPARAGFTQAVAVRSASPTGSSPLARGLREELAEGDVVFRIIPARAGFTDELPGTKYGREDHPRSRGVYRLRKSLSGERSGSSPLARGLLRPVGRPPISARIIPARAGFTRPRVPGMGVRWDHPRSRGVYPVPGLSDLIQSGSSPLARGLPGIARAMAAFTRIIPARAGFTEAPVSISRYYSDHPRSRGVYRQRYAQCCTDCGSSPLARGLLHGVAVLWCSIRIIPARAGFTWKRAFRFVVNADHPRSRGVYHS